MRALIPISTTRSLSTNEDELRVIAEENFWLVREPEKARHILDAVLEDSANQDLAEIEGEYCFSVEILEYQIIGVFGIMGDHLIKIRLLGVQDVDVLKRACEQIVAMCKQHDEALKQQRDKEAIGFRFGPKILIRAKEHNEIIARGFIPDQSPFRHAWQQQYVQGLVVKIGCGIFLACSLATYPLVAHSLFGSLISEPAAMEWLIGIIGRVGTTAIIAAIVAYLNIHQLAQRFKQSGGVVW